MATNSITRIYGAKSVKLFKALKKAGIVGTKGTIKLNLLNTDVDISDKSAVGNLLQEWLGRWMENNDIFFRVNKNTQEFPDFYLSKSKDLDLLEVKTFDYANSPNFDVANFDAYTRSLRTKAYRLNADYLIMGYSLSKGVVAINDIWLKKVWEITCPSEQYKLRTQVKQNKIVNIRPYNFKSKSKGFQPFKNRLEFVFAIKATLSKYAGKTFADNWFFETAQCYKKLTKESL